MRKLFKERKLFKGGNYMRKYGNLNSALCTNVLSYRQSAGKPVRHAKPYKYFNHSQHWTIHIFDWLKYL